MSVEKQILYQVDVRGQEDLFNEMAKIRRETTELRNENNKYNKSLKDGTPLSDAQAKNFEKNNAQIQVNNRRLRELTKETSGQQKGAEGLRRRLTELRREMQEVAFESGVNSDRFIELRNEASQLQDTVDHTQQQIKFYADDMAIIKGLGETMQGTVGIFRAGVGATAMLGFESEKFQETMQRLVAVQQLSQGIEQAMNMVRKESAVTMTAQAIATKGVIVAKQAAAIATGAWTAAVQFFSKAVYGIPVFGWIAAAITGIIIVVRTIINYWDELTGWFSRVGDAISNLINWFRNLDGWLKTIVYLLGAPIAPILLLIEHFGVVRDAIMRVIDTLVFWKDLRKETDETAESTENMAEAALEARKNTVLLETALKYLEKQMDRNVTGMEREIETMKARGESADEIREKERQLLEYQIKATEHRINLQIRETMAMAQRLGMSQRITEESLRQKLMEEEGLDDLKHQLELFNIEEQNLYKERVEEKRNNTQQLLEQERLYHLELEHLTKNSVDTAIALEKYKQQLEREELEEKIANNEATYAELELLEFKHQQKLREIDEQFKEVDEEKAEEEKEEAEEERERLREEYLEEMERRRLDEMTDFEIRAEMYKNWLDSKAISDEEYAELKQKLDKEVADFEIEMAHKRATANAQHTAAIIGNLGKVVGAESEAAKFAKAIALFEVGMNIVKGFSEAAAAGPPQNIPLILLYTAQTAGLMSEIKSLSEPSTPSFGSGGTWGAGLRVGGRSHSSGGTKYYGEDGNVVEFERDEYLAIINKRDASRAAMLDTINQRHGDSLFGNNKKYFASGGVIEGLAPRTDFEAYNITDIVQETIEGVAQIPVVLSEREVTDTQRRVSMLEKEGDL